MNNAPYPPSRYLLITVLASVVFWSLGNSAQAQFPGPFDNVQPATAPKFTNFLVWSYVYEAGPGLITGIIDVACFSAARIDSDSYPPGPQTRHVRLNAGGVILDQTPLYPAGGRPAPPENLLRGITTLPAAFGFGGFFLTADIDFTLERTFLNANGDIVTVPSDHVALNLPTQKLVSASDFRAAYFPAAHKLIVQLDLDWENNTISPDSVDLQFFNYDPHTGTWITIESVTVMDNSSGQRAVFCVMADEDYIYDDPTHGKIVAMRLNAAAAGFYDGSPVYIKVVESDEPVPGWLD